MKKSELQKLIREEVRKVLKEADSNPDLDFDRVVEALRVAKIPCKVVLNEFGGKLSIEILCGFNYPDSLVDKIYDALDPLNLPNEPNISADFSGGTNKKSISIAGGPKRY